VPIAGPFLSGAEEWQVGLGFSFRGIQGIMILQTSWDCKAFCVDFSLKSPAELTTRSLYNGGGWVQLGFLLCCFEQRMV
jgi:hypothetical protein